MKKFIFALLLASFTLMGVSCQKETEFVEEEVLSSVYFVAGYDEQPDTKATLQKDESYNKFIWQTGDQIRLYATTTENGKQSYTATLIPESANTSLGTFEASKSLDAGSKVNFAAFPYDLSGGTSSAFLEYPAKISEYVSGGLFTPMLAVPAEPIVVAEGETYDDICFNHVGGALKFTLKSVPAGVNNVVFTATENITGKHFVNTETVSTSTVKDGSWKAGTPQGEGKSVTFEFEALASAQDMVFYVPVLADVKLTSTLSIEVKAATGSVQTFEKTFKEGASYTVKRAVVANLGEFTVTGTVPEASVKYNLLTDVSDLEIGDFVVIAAAESDFAISTTQNTNNRGQASVMKSGNTIACGDDVQIMTLEGGTKSGTYAFYTGDGYLAAASSGSNHLKTPNTKDDNSSWSISVTEAGVATIIAQGSYSRKVLQYNQSSSIFACYASANQEAVAIYYKKDTRTALAAPTVTATLVGKNGASLSWGAVENAATYQVYLDGNPIDAVIDMTGNPVTATVESLPYNKLCSFTVVAKPEANNSTYKNSAHSTAATVETEAPAIETLTVSEFSSKGVSDNVWYQLTGTVSNITSKDYGNFTLTDKTGSITVLGLTKTMVEENDKSFASLGIGEGDEVTLVGVRGQDNSDPCVSGYINGSRTYPAYYVTHVAVPRISLTPSTLTFDADKFGESAAKTVTVDFSSAVTPGDIVFALDNETNFAFSVSTDKKTVTIYPKAENTSEDNAITAEFTATYGSLVATVTLTQTKAVAAGSLVSDVIDKTATEATGTSYVSWEITKDKTKSGAAYVGQSAGGNSSVQLRSKENSGIVTTISGGNAKKVTLVWNSATNSARIVDIYGSNTAYTSAADLYDSSKQGKKIGSIKKSESTISIDADYKYIGIRSNDGALYLTSITIDWEK